MTTPVLNENSPDMLHFGRSGNLENMPISTNKGSSNLSVSKIDSCNYHITSPDGSEPLATVEQLKGPSSIKAPSVQFYDGKGGFMGILSTEDHNYLVFPGASATLGNIKLTLAPLAKPLVDPYDNKTEPVLPPKGPVQDLTDVAMITGAGLSSRFEPGPQYTGHSKPAFMIAPNQSMISRLAEHLKGHGIKHLFVNTFYRPTILKNGLKSVEGDNLKLHYIDEPEPSGSAGAIPKMLADPNMLKYLKGKNLIVMMGDSVTNMDVSALVDAHKKNNAAVTLGCMPVPDEDLGLFGIVVTDHSGKDGVSGKIDKFVEKPGNTLEGKAKIGKSRLCNTGAYVISPEVFPIFQKALLEAGEKQCSNGGLDFAQNIFPAVIEEIEAGNLKRDGKPMQMYAQQVQGYWNDIGNMQQYAVTLDHVAKGLLGDKPDMKGFFENGQIFWGKDTQQNAFKKDGAQLSGHVLVAPRAIAESKDSNKAG